jgi:hypothetical protein
MDYPTFVVEPTDEDVLVSLVYNDYSQMDIMKDGRVFAWTFDFEDDDELVGYIYLSQEDYNDNLWLYKGRINRKTHLPSGFCEKYCEDTDDVIHVFCDEHGEESEVIINE